MHLDCAGLQLHNSDHKLTSLTGVPLRSASALDGFGRSLGLFMGRLPSHPISSSFPSVSRLAHGTMPA